MAREEAIVSPRSHQSHHLKEANFLPLNPSFLSGCHPLCRSHLGVVCGDAASALMCSRAVNGCCDAPAHLRFLSPTISPLHPAGPPYQRPTAALPPPPEHKHTPRRTQTFTHIHTPALAQITTSNAHMRHTSANDVCLKGCEICAWWWW